MGSESWSSTANCKTAGATVFCRADSTFLCRSCDGKVRAINKLASSHACISVCKVCEQAPAIVTCEADAAALCPTCDRDIHSANLLARRRERLPIVPFYDAVCPHKIHSLCLPCRRISRGGISDSFMAPTVVPIAKNERRYPFHIES